MGVQKDNVLCHCVLDEELLEIPESKVGDFGNLGIPMQIQLQIQIQIQILQANVDFENLSPSCHKHVARLEVTVHHWTSHVVQASDSLSQHN